MIKKPTPAEIAWLIIVAQPAQATDKSVIKSSEFKIKFKVEQIINIISGDLLSPKARKIWSAKL